MGQETPEPLPHQLLGEDLSGDAAGIRHERVEDLRLVAEPALTSAVEVARVHFATVPASVQLDRHQHEQPTVSVHVRQAAEVRVVDGLDVGGVERVQFHQLGIREGLSGIRNIVQPNRMLAYEPNHRLDFDGRLPRYVEGSPVAGGQRGPRNDSRRRTCRPFGLSQTRKQGLVSSHRPFVGRAPDCLAHVCALGNHSPRAVSGGRSVRRRRESQTGGAALLKSVPAAHAPGRRSPGGARHQVVSRSSGQRDGRQA